MQGLSASANPFPRFSRNPKSGLYFQTVDAANLFFWSANIPLYWLAVEVDMRASAECKTCLILNV